MDNIISDRDRFDAAFSNRVGGIERRCRQLRRQHSKIHGTSAKQERDSMAERLALLELVVNELAKDANEICRQVELPVLELVTESAAAQQTDRANNIVRFSHSGTFQSFCGVCTTD